jgi:hypothetical protein
MDCASPGASREISFCIFWLRKISYWFFYHSKRSDYRRSPSSNAEVGYSCRIDLSIGHLFVAGRIGYAGAQDTASGPPAGTKPMTPEPVMNMHHHKHHHSMYPKHHDTAAPMAAPPTPRNKKTRAPRAPPERLARQGVGRIWTRLVALTE